MKTLNRYAIAALVGSFALSGAALAGDDKLDRLDADKDGKITAAEYTAGSKDCVRQARRECGRQGHGGRDGRCLHDFQGRPSALRRLLRPARGSRRWTRMVTDRCPRSSTKRVPARCSTSWTRKGRQPDRSRDQGWPRSEGRHQVLLSFRSDGQEARRRPAHAAVFFCGKGLGAIFVPAKIDSRLLAFPDYERTPVTTCRRRELLRLAPRATPARSSVSAPRAQCRCGSTMTFPPYA